MTEQARAKAKIFVSSTFVDLGEVRGRVTKWLDGIFEAGLVIMETFGSDAAPPDVISVRRVRECDLFVGIYAHRYGSIDPVSGKSITELELDEARQSFSSGSLRDILLYVLPEEAWWLAEYRDTNSEAVAGRRRLRDKARGHTHTVFRTVDELLFDIIRDVRRKLDEHFRALPLTLRPFSLPARKKLQQPVGMEFVTSDLQDYLIGREEKAEQLLALLNRNSTVLLLGESGCGKTSLVHAGLVPKVVGLGWRPVLCRPFGLPCSDTVQQIQSSIFGGIRSHRSELTAVLAEAVAALGGSTLLLIIDQFEDVLIARDPEDVRLLISTLSSLRQLGNPCMKTLVCYRADLEARLGEYWQIVSGSASGLPRAYVAGIDQEGVWARIQKTATDLDIDLNIGEAEANQVERDLATAGRQAGVRGIYPPHVQMLIDHLWKFSKTQKSGFTAEDYKRAGGLQGIVGNYLSRQLDYAQDAHGDLKSVLVSLVRSYGVKAQKELTEVIADTGLDPGTCEMALEKLIDLRLVRHVETYYEITHDFVAKKILNELVDSEEKEFKRFRELFSSKAVAYNTTQSGLTPEELLMLYKHRQRLMFNDQELNLLLVSFLDGTGPTLYWLLNTPPEKLAALLSATGVSRPLSVEQKANCALLRRKLGANPFRDGDFSCFRDYQHSWELSQLIAEDSPSLPRTALSFGLRHRREEVREAALSAIAEHVKKGELNWISALRNSSSFPTFQAYLRLVFRRDIPRQATKGASRAVLEFSLLQCLEQAVSTREARSQWRQIAQMRPPNRVRTFAKALRLAKAEEHLKLLTLCDRLSKDGAALALEALGSEVSVAAMEHLLKKLQSWTTQLRARSDVRWHHSKSLALADAVARSSTSHHLSQLRRCVESLSLDPPIRQVVLTLLTHGSASDLENLLGKIAGAHYEVKFWNHTELGHRAAALMARQTDGIPTTLQDAIRRKEFWTYLPGKERKSASQEDLLPIKNLSNRALFVRLAGYGIIGAARVQDASLLARLSGHGYGLLARAAAMRLADLLHEDALKLLTKEIDVHIQRRDVESLSDALRFAEMRVFGLI